MIVRIVQLQFLPDEARSAKEKVMAISSKVRSFKGCRYLDILEDVHHAGRVVTYSHWDDERALNDYRKSDIFRDFWASIKPHFEIPARAQSTKIAAHLP